MLDQVSRDYDVECGSEIKALRVLGAYVEAPAAKRKRVAFERIDTDNRLRDGLNPLV